MRANRSVSRLQILAAFILLLLAAACGEDGGSPNSVPSPTPSPTPAPQPTPTPTPTPSPTPSPTAVTVEFSFRQSDQPWKAVFADYRADLAPIFFFGSGISSVPPELVGTNGFMLSSSNRSDDVFMGIYRAVDGLVPNSIYRVESTFVLASNSGRGCLGAGGAPGEGNYVKAGASSVVPSPSTSGFVQLPLDKGNQGTSGRDMVVIGNLATPENAACDATARYVRKTLTTDQASAPQVRTDSTGRLWLILGTDSGYEGITTYYVLEGRFQLTPL